jgi:tetratricopeptide (TPR) repeat protein
LELLSRQGRVLLQAGAVPQARVLLRQAADEFARAKAAVPVAVAYPAVQRAPAQVLVNEGLVSFAQGDHDTALESFRRAVEFLRSIRVVSSNSNNYQPDDWMGLTLLQFTSLDTLYSETMNNMSLCAIYTCRLQEAIHVMECLVREDPSAFLTERVVMNLWYVKYNVCETCESQCL